MSELKLSIAQLLIDNFKGATSKKASDMAIAIMAFVNADREREIESAFCGTPGTGECSCRKFADNPLKCDNRHTQPEATKPAQPLYASNAASTACEGTGPKLHVRPVKPAQDLGAAIDWLRNNYQDHTNIASLCDAMCAALASSSDALVAGDRVDAELAKADQSPVPITNQELAAFHRFCDCCEDFDSGGHDVEKSMMSQLVRIGLVRPAGPGRHETTKFGDWLRDSAAIQAQKDGHG